MTRKKLTADDLEWETPTRSRAGGAMTEMLCEQIGEMRAALSARRGDWAVLETFDKPAKASSTANAIAKRAKSGNDSRLVGVEVAGRKMRDGGSKLYVRIVA